MFYFAYGSNLSSRRLGRRLSPITRVGTRLLPGYSLRFHKVGWRDNSAKCDAYQTGQPDDLLYGVLYDIQQDHLPLLDEIEGLGQGYERREVRLSAPDQLEAEMAFTYVATWIDETLTPYDWYCHHVLQGAIESAFPESYIDAIRKVRAMPDPDSERARIEWAVHSID